MSIVHFGQKLLIFTDFLQNDSNCYMFMLRWYCKVMRKYAETTVIYLININNRLIGPVGWVFVNGPGDLGSILGRVIPKTLKMVLDTSLLNTQ